MKRTTHHMLKIFLCLLILTLLVGIGGYIFTSNYVVLNGKAYSRASETLDFHGQQVPDLDVLAELSDLKSVDFSNTDLTLGEHEWLHQKLPDCDIIWEIEFQGRHYPPDATSIRVEHLTEADLVLLDYLPQLTYVDARNCQDYTALGKLVKSWPDCWVDYSVELGGGQFGPGSRNLRLRNADAESLQQGLPGLPNAEKVYLTGKLPAMEEITALQKSFPDTEFQWDVLLNGSIYPSTTLSLDLALGMEPDLEALPEKLAYFPKLENVNFQGTLSNSDQRNLLREQLPAVNLNWDYDLGGVPVPVTITELDLTGNTDVTIEQLDQALPYLTDLKKVVLCDCGLPNQPLADLNEKYENVRLIWNVDVGGQMIRTDELFYAPNKFGIRLKKDEAYNLRYCTDMVCVDVGHAKGLMDCEWAAFMPELRFLIMADANIADLTPLQNLKKLEYLELFLSPVMDVSPLLGCTGLKDLNLCYTRADPAPVAQMTWLKRLWWSGSWAAKDLLQDKLPNTHKDFQSPSSTGNGWREGELYYEMRDFIGMEYMIG